MEAARRVGARDAAARSHLISNDDNRADDRSFGGAADDARDVPALAQGESVRAGQQKQERERAGAQKCGPALGGRWHGGL
jgi:hypothetical protein